VIFKKSEKFDGDITIDGKPLAEVKSFYLPDLSGKDMDKLALLSGGKNPGKPFKELNFAELCDLFPQIRGCDVLLLDKVGLKLEPVKDMVILKINPIVPDNDYTIFCRVKLEKDGYYASKKERREDIYPNPPPKSGRL
jgi:hypothetical protein